MTDDEIARQAREIAAFCIPSSWNELPLSPHARAILVGAAETRILAVLRTTASAAWVEGWNSAKEAAAKLVELGYDDGVAAVKFSDGDLIASRIRALQPLPPKKEIG